MKLYYFTGSCALAPHIALEWAGADYELSEMKRSETRAPEFLKKNPAGKVPVLELDDGRCIAQVNAVLQFIAETWPEAGLGPGSNGDGSAGQAARHAALAVALQRRCPHQLHPLLHDPPLRGQRRRQGGGKGPRGWGSGLPAQDRRPSIWPDGTG